MTGSASGTPPAPRATHIHVIDRGAVAWIARGGETAARAAEWRERARAEASGSAIRHWVARPVGCRITQACLWVLRKGRPGLQITAQHHRTTGAAFEYRRFDAPIGAEIRGLDLSRSLKAATFSAVRQCFLDSQGVLVLRDQRITPEQHIAFSRRFGPLAIHVLHQFLLPGHPEILLVSNVMKDGKPVGLGDAGRYWHSDLSYLAAPSLGSLLHAQEIPREGGDTSFANMSAAYEALSASVKRRIEGKRAVHSYRKTYDRIAGSTFRPPLTEAQKQEVQEVDHPIVRTHAETGRKALFINEGFHDRHRRYGERRKRRAIAAPLCA